MRLLFILRVVSLANSYNSHILQVNHIPASFYIVQSHAWGPTPFVSKEGRSYYVLLIDDYSRFTWTDVISWSVQLFATIVCTQLDSPIRAFCGDSAGEYISDVHRHYICYQGYSSTVLLLRCSLRMVSLSVSIATFLRQLMLYFLLVSFQDPPS